MLEEIDALSADLLRRVLIRLDADQLDAMALAIADLRSAVETSIAGGPRPPPRLHARSTIASTMRGAEGPPRRTTHDLAPSRRRD